MRKQIHPDRERANARSFEGNFIDLLGNTAFFHRRSRMNFLIAGVSDAVDVGPRW